MKSAGNGQEEDAAIYIHTPQKDLPARRPMPRGAMSRMETVASHRWQTQRRIGRGGCGKFAGRAGLLLRPSFFDVLLLVVATVHCRSAEAWAHRRPWPIVVLVRQRQGLREDGARGAGAPA